jgi:hypothetical protein
MLRRWRGSGHDKQFLSGFLTSPDLTPGPSPGERGDVFIATEVNMTSILFKSGTSAQIKKSSITGTYLLPPLRGGLGRG